MAIFQHLNRERGLTIVLVTHEPDIAAQAGRVVGFRDGRVVVDRLCLPRSSAMPSAAYRSLGHAVC
jgi:putative ABC transport system ATP-binding protein